MHVYRPKKKFVYTPSKMNKKKVIPVDKDNLKQYNLDFDVTDPNMVKQLQQSLGNRGALVMLQELGKVGLDEQEVTQHGDVKGQIIQKLEQDEMNPSMALKKEVEEFNKLGLVDNNKSLDAVRSGRFATNNRKKNKPNTKKMEFANNFRGFLQLVNVLKVYINKDEAKEIESDEGDMLLGHKEKVIRDEVDMLLKMIRRLPDYNDNNEEVLERYFKAYKFVIASGINLNKLFQYNGSLRKQRDLLIESVESKE